MSASPPLRPDALGGEPGVVEPGVGGRAGREGDGLAGVALAGDGLAGDTLAGDGLGAAAVDAVKALARRVLEADGHPPFSDGSLIALAQGRRRVVWAGDTAGDLAGNTADVSVGGAAHATRGAAGDPAGGVAGVAIIADGDAGDSDSAGELELAIDPDARRRGHGTRLLESALQSARPGLLAWAHGAHPAARTLAARYRFDAVRELLVLRAEVPGGHSLRAPELCEPGTSTSAGAVLAFDAEHDADEWVALNAKAFAAHPEQGAVSRGDLDTLMREPWFEARDFLVLRDDDGAMRGYCWLKVEPGDPAADDTVGELYVLGVDPDWQGRGAGRALLEAGFARLRERGIRRVELYVEADNAAALALYRSAGFAEASRDIQYRWRG